MMAMKFVKTALKTNPNPQPMEITMNSIQIKKQLESMQQMLKDMKQERDEASAVYPQDHWILKDIDEDILLCSLAINDLQIELIKNR